MRGGAGNRPLRTGSLLTSTQSLRRASLTRARRAFWSLSICCLKFPSSELVRRILCASPSAMLFPVPLG
ncbi:hypothetical protein EMCRGX_G014406 [Ephydatia muelleri]